MSVPSPSVGSSTATGDVTVHLKLPNMDTERAAGLTHLEHAAQVLADQLAHGTQESFPGLMNLETGMPRGVGLGDAGIVQRVVKKLLGLFHGETIATVEGVWDCVELDGPVSGHNVTKFIKSLAAAAQLSMWAFRVLPARDSVMAASNLSIILATGETKPFFPCYEDIMPHAKSFIGFQGQVDWILVVEEVFFYELLNSKILEDKSLGYGVMLTGIPDDCSTRMLNLLADSFRKAPVLGLFHAEPICVKMLCEYKYGSRENRYAADAHDCQRLQWLGMHISDFLSLGVQIQQMLPLKPYDVALLDEIESHNDLPQDWKTELDLMRRTGAAYIQAAYSGGDDRQLMAWIRTKIVQSQQ